MKVVTMTKAMRPWQAGDPAVVPDDLAAKLVKDGDAKDPRPFPPPDVAPTVAVGKPTPAPRRGYMTRKRA